MFVSLATLISACATPPAPPPVNLFNDEKFVAPKERVDAAEVFALSDQMKRYVRFEIANQLRDEGRLHGLINALYRRDQLKLEYDAAQTSNAAQTFAARKGNCLSLVIMTAAFAKELQLTVAYQSVDSEDTWSRIDDIAFLSTHVNVTLGKGAEALPGFDPTRTMTVDFLPSNEILGLHTRQIREKTIVAMYMNNRAAEALAHGQVDDAYWWARGAVVSEPDFVASYNTLGVIYLRHGDLEAADAAFTHALAYDQRDKQALSNLAIVLERQGRHDESNTLRTRLAQLESFPPYHFYFLGLEAMKRGDFLSAKSLFAREVDRAGYCSEFHFWLGIANLKLGNVEEARRQITEAMASSTTSTDRNLYAAKLERLHSYGAKY
jgi:tetratricopeptide (TPR) repeat protein